LLGRLEAARLLGLTPQPPDRFQDRSLLRCHGVTEHWVHSKSAFMMVKTWGNGTSDFTLGSQLSLPSAWVNAVPFTFLLSLSSSQRAAATT